MMLMTDPQYDSSISKQIAVVVLLLMAVGTVFVFSASANVTHDLDLSKFYQYASLRQLLFFAIAVLVMWASSGIDYKRLNMTKGLLKSPATYLITVSTILLIIVLIPGLGTEMNYARRWLRIPLGPASISFQPSELAKWAVIIFIAAIGHHYNEKLRSFFGGFLPVCGVIGLVAGLVLLEDFGTSALICLLSFLMLIIAGAKWLHILGPLPFAAGAFFAAIMSSPERQQRILAFMHPDKWTDSINYQPSQSLIALGSGGSLGKGLGFGISKYGHLPEDTTDFIFAIIGEELGLVGTISVILLFIAFIWLGIVVVIRCKDPFGQLLASGIVLAVAIQAALNIGVVTVVLPTKGIPLPFISAGGTSLLLSAAAVGVLLNIAKQSPTNTNGVNE